jgi:glycosyltransferase involved in cell wall biosynthesis
LLLLSTEEQFGHVVAEALALGVPVICSLQCGARDCLILSNINGFIVEPDNIIGAARFLLRLDDPEIFSEMSTNARAIAAENGVERFVDAVKVHLS